MIKFILQCKIFYEVNGVARWQRLWNRCLQNPHALWHVVSLHNYNMSFGIGVWWPISILLDLVSIIFFDFWYPFQFVPFKMMLVTTANTCTTIRNNAITPTDTPTATATTLVPFLVDTTTSVGRSDWEVTEELVGGPEELVGGSEELVWEGVGLIGGPDWEIVRSEVLWLGSVVGGK